MEAYSITATGSSAVGDGYTCSQCGTWVGWNQTHTCTWTTPNTWGWSWPTCEHCLCIPADKPEGSVVEHRKCCRCKQVRGKPSSGDWICD